MHNASHITGTVSARERALLDALQSIVMETMDYPLQRPFSTDSYLPEHMVNAAQGALANYGLALVENCRTQKVAA